MSYQILIDSCGDLSQGMRENPRIEMVPLRIQVGKKEYIDDEKINCREMLEDIASSPNMPLSSCPSPSQFVDALDKEADRIYVITGSSALSGSYNSACLAKKMWQEEKRGKNGQRICVIEERC